MAPQHEHEIRPWCPDDGTMAGGVELVQTNELTNLWVKLSWPLRPDPGPFTDDGQTLSVVFGVNRGWNQHQQFLQLIGRLNYSNSGQS